MLIRRMVLSADFERVLGVRSRIQSTHFALHHLSVAVASGQEETVQNRGAQLESPENGKLSTGTLLEQGLPVDEDPEFDGLKQDREKSHCIWLGTVVPKRHARLSVTRSMLKRQIRASVASRAGDLNAGMWVVRLRAPFEVSAFHSAASKPLRSLARDELDQLIDRAS